MTATITKTSENFFPSNAWHRVCHPEQKAPRTETQTPAPQTPVAAATWKKECELWRRAQRTLTAP